jgi:hypothetical protein
MRANLRGGWRETLKVVNSFALLEPSSHDASLVLLVHSIGKLEVQHPLARNGLDAGRKSRDLDDTPAAHLLERIILKIQRSFPEHSIRSDECVLILERLSVGGRDEVAKSGEEALELATDKKQLVYSKRLGGDSRASRRQRLTTSRRFEHRAGVDARRLLA